MDIKTIIKNARSLGLPARHIAYIIEQPIDIVQNILERNGWNSNRRPGSMPDSYFIEKLAANTPISDIATELGCSRDAVYKLIQRRGLMPDAYRGGELD